MTTAIRKRGLGKGLNELGLNELLSDVVPQVNLAVKVKNDELKKMTVDQLQPGKYQPRRRIPVDSLEELASSIRSQGIIQPLVVRGTSNGKYEIIAGERRWRAAQLAGLTDVPVIVREINDETAMAISLIENIQRQDLNVIEEALALKRLIEEFEMTHQEVAEAVGKSRTSVTNTLRLLKLTPEVLSLVEQGHLDMGHARALLAIDEIQQSEVANHVVARSLSVRETEKLINRLQVAASKAQLKTLVAVDMNQVERSLKERLGTDVQIKHGSKGKGRLVINYSSTDELDAIIERIH
jgi:ParB family chromosome partitioning protein